MRIVDIVLLITMYFGAFLTVGFFGEYDINWTKCFLSLFVVVLFIIQFRKMIKR